MNEFLSAKIISICNDCRAKYGKQPQEFVIDGTCAKCGLITKVSLADDHELIEPQKV